MLDPFLRRLAVRKNINKKQLNATKRSFKDMESLLDHSLYIQKTFMFEPPKCLVRRLLGVPNTDSPGRIVDVWGFTFLIEYMESLISINYSQVRDEDIGNTHICFCMLYLAFNFCGRGGVSGGSNPKNQTTRCLLGSGH